MTEQGRVEPDWDDAEGHALKRADAETAEGDDTEGHRRLHADAESAEGDDDVEGHYRKM